MTALALHAIEARETRNAFGGAVGIHALLAIGLLVSLNWNQDAPKPVQAELWSGLPRDIPQTKQPPTPAVKPEPPAPPAPAPAPEEKADISLQKKKADPPKKQEPTKAELQKEKERQEELKKQLLKKQAEEQSVTKRLEAQRQAELARLGIDPNAKPSTRGKDVATKTGVVTGGADIGAKTGADADYRAQIASRIQLNITHREITQGNPEAIVEIEQWPTGEIRKKTLLRSSGIPSYDQAVLSAIDKSSPLPKKKDGSVVTPLTLKFRPND